MKILVLGKNLEQSSASTVVSFPLVKSLKKIVKCDFDKHQLNDQGNDQYDYI